MIRMITIHQKDNVITGQHRITPGCARYQKGEPGINKIYLNDVYTVVPCKMRKFTAWFSANSRTSRPA